MVNKILTLLGFAQKSGNLVTGESTCELYLKKKQISLLIVSIDTSENTLKKVTGYAAKYNVPLYQFSSKDELSMAIGKVNRAVIGIKDQKFASKIVELLKQMDLIELK